MAGKPGGKSVGRVTIRVLPDSSDFKAELKKKLAVIEKQIHFTVNVDKVKIDRAAIQAQLKAQFAKIKGFAVDVEAHVDVTKFYQDTKKLRAALEKELEEEKLALQLTLDERALLKFRHDIKVLQDQVEKNTLNFKLDVFTTYVSARLAWLARTRFVTLIPQLSEKAVAKVATQLAALSGARVAFDWVEDIVRFVGRLDQTLPRLGLIISSIGSLVSVTLSAISGTLALGSGLAALVPLLLILPGMILGTAVAIVAFGVAMAEASTQLSPLKDDMQELADIIQSGFWDEARDPIISLVDTLMPQLREAFDEVSRSLGRFTAKFAEAFERKLAGGKLRALFKGIADSFDILATGTDSFAGAIVSLSAVAAKYSPRLAQWFVDIAIQFDTWLDAVANDGRLDGWIEEGIAALKDLGRATSGVYRIFRGLWRAAEAAGSGGIKGFADNMERIADVVEGPRFQSTMQAFFRGAAVGTEAIGDGLERIGDMLYTLRYDWEYVLGQLGVIFGGFIGDIADAMNRPDFGEGLREFVDGLRDGFESFGDSLPALSQGVQDLLEFAGELARQLGPVLGAAIGGLSEALGPFLDYLTTEVLPELGPALTTAIEELTPELKSFMEEFGPFLKGLSDLAIAVLPALTGALKELNKLLKFDLDFYGGSFSLLADEDFWAQLWNEDAYNRIKDKAMAGTFGDFYDTAFTWADQFDADWQNWWDNDFMAWWTGENIAPEFKLPSFDELATQNETDWGNLQAKLENGWNQITDWWNGTVVPGWNGLWATFTSAVALGWGQTIIAWTNGWNQLVGAWNTVVNWWNNTVVPGWNRFWGDVGKSFENGWAQITAFFTGLPLKLFLIGRDMIQGLINGVSSMISKAVKAIKDVGGAMLDGILSFLGAKSPSTLFRDEVGKQITAGIIEGIEAGQPELDAALQAAVSPTLNAYAAPLPSLGGTFGPTYQASFNLNPDPGIPLADQVFQASQRLKARTLVRSVA